MTADQDIQHEAPQAPEPRAGRRSELAVFVTLAILIWPVIAVGVVGAYGFLVWMWQIVFGPPGPPG
jgi:periplasmic nitrate reductase NapE